jgi:hypothetical protein
MCFGAGCVWQDSGLGVRPQVLPDRAAVRALMAGRAAASAVRLYCRWLCMQDVYGKLQELASGRKCCLTVLAASGALSAATLTQASEA